MSQRQLCYRTPHAVTALVMACAWIFTAPTQAQLVQTQTQNASSIGQYEKFELTFTLSRSYTNPFDVDEVDILVTFVEPGGSEKTIPAFYYKEFDAVPGANETYVNGRDPSWKARFAPSKLGVHSYSITITDGFVTDDLTAGASTFNCVASANKGFIGLDVRDPYFLRHETGEPYHPIGHNVAWAANNTGLAWWAQHFTSCNASGLNWARVWMTDFFVGQSIEWTSALSYFQGAGVWSLEHGWKLDRIFEFAEQDGIYIQLALQHHGQVSTTTNPQWAQHPYNIANSAIDGGWLANAEDFFTNATARNMTRDKYRYIVARWGYSTALHSWELFNEVQWTDGWIGDQTSVVNWHAEMAAHIRGHDPFNHIISTSSDGPGFDAFWNLALIDHLQLHSYALSTVPAMKTGVDSLTGFSKPVFVGEFGLFPIVEPDYNLQGEPELTQLMEGLTLHNGIWAAHHMRSSAHYWWWDLYIEPLDLFGKYEALVAYATGEDYAAHGLELMTPTMAGASYLDTFAMVGGNHAYLWIYDRDSRYGESDHGVTSGASFSLDGFTPGFYTVTHHATRGVGGILYTENLLSADGTIASGIPDFSQDVGVKVKPFNGGEPLDPVWVEFDGEPGGDGSFQAPLATLVGAVSVVLEGGTIKIFASESAHGILITKPLSIEAFGGTV